MGELLKTAKQCLSIVETATLKDEEIKMWIKAGIADLIKKGINASETTEDNLIKSAIIMFVKSNFGNVDIKEKELAQRTYSLLCDELSLSKKYRIKEIPIVFRERPDGSESKINTFSDGIKVIKTIIKMFKDHKPLKFFSIIFAILFILGLLVGLPVIIEFCKTGYITKMPSAILATGLITLAVISEQCGVILQTIVKQHREDYELNLLRYQQIEEIKRKN